MTKANAIKQDIEKNKARKVEIQQMLAANAAELLQFNNLIDLNLKEQEAARARHCEHARRPGSREGPNEQD
ncbi:MAG: hypothetical protein WKG07_11620 [Hymenobacter sp.]